MEKYYSSYTPQSIIYKIKKERSISHHRIDERCQGDDDFQSRNE